MDQKPKERRRSFKTQDKLRIVLEALEGSISKAAVARRNEVNANQLSRWVREYQRGEHWAAPVSKSLIPVVVESASSENIVPPEEPHSVTMAPFQDNAAPLPELHIRFTNGNELSIKHATVAHLKTLVGILQ